MDDQMLVEAVDQQTDKVAPEASEEIYVSLWDKLSTEL